MGNGKDFFARDAEGRRSEYVSLAPPITVNGVTPQTCISAKTSMGLFKAVCILEIKCFWILIGVITMKIQMVASSRVAWSTFRCGGKMDQLTSFAWETTPE